MGYTKAQKYGEEILATIFAFLEVNNLLKLFPTFEPPTIPISIIWKDPLSDEATHLRSVSSSMDHQARRMSNTQLPMNCIGPFSTSTTTITNTATTTTKSSNSSNIATTNHTNLNATIINNINGNHSNTLQISSKSLQRGSTGTPVVNNYPTQYMMSSFQPSDYDEIYKDLSNNYNDQYHNNYDENDVTDDNDAINKYTSTSVNIGNAGHNNNHVNNTTHHQHNNPSQTNFSENLSGLKRSILRSDHHRDHNGDGDSTIDNMIFGPVSNKKIYPNPPYFL
jgi:hypothetical protein